MLNLSKTKCIIFDDRLTQTKKLMVNEVEMEIVYEIKFLGVIIGNKL